MLSSIKSFSILVKEIGFWDLGKGTGLCKDIGFLSLGKGIGLDTLDHGKETVNLDLCGLLIRSSNHFLRRFL